jgi:sugar phosphate isomerase/epimerase
MELDIAWAIKGGADVIALFQNNQDRFPLWHVKDLDASHENIMPVGSGTIDYKKIFAAANVAGMKHIFIEHDFPKDAFASVSESYNYLHNVLKV